LEEYSPKAIVVMTISGILFYFSLLIACWPVWGWKIIPILFIFFMAFLNIGAFLPSN